MNRTQRMRICGLLVIMLALVVYGIFGAGLLAQETSPATSDEGSTATFSCASPANSLETSSPTTIEGGAEFELTGLSVVDYANGDTVVSGIWRLPAGVSLRIEDGTQAWVQVSAGAIELGPCDGSGVIDTKQNDKQVTRLASGESVRVESTSDVMIFLGESEGSFHLTASESDGALVWIEVLEATTDTVFCDAQQCWGMADATSIPSAQATPGAGCVGVRCWTR